MKFNLYSHVLEGRLTLTELKEMYYSEYVDFLSSLTVKQDIEAYQNFKQSMKLKESMKNNSNQDNN